MFGLYGRIPLSNQLVFPEDCEHFDFKRSQTLRCAKILVFRSIFAVSAKIGLPIFQKITKIGLVIFAVSSKVGLPMFAVCSKIGLPIFQNIAFIPEIWGYKFGSDCHTSCLTFQFIV